jgi:flavin reductase (DIM6/NTAB) family NADH-FMN oxidoreductase RutF
VRFLADMGVSLTTVEALRAANHDTVHLRDEGLIRLPQASSSFECEIKRQQP